MLTNALPVRFTWFFWAATIWLSTHAPAIAWEAKLGQVCELIHDEGAASVRLTFDPTIPEYTISITLNRAWSEAPIFAIRFDGPRGLTISTKDHALSANGTTLTVRDRGFDNVLNGIEFNETATALVGDQGVTVSLNGSAPAVQAFRVCSTGVGV